LEYSAIPIVGADYLTQGAGEINAAGAIALGYGIDTFKNPGSIWLTGVPTYTVIGTDTCVWSAHIIYGDVVLEGAVIYSNNIVWSTNIVWGTAATGTWSAAVIEAANILWCTHI